MSLYAVSREILLIRDVDYSLQPLPSISDLFLSSLPLVDVVPCMTLPFAVNIS